MPQVVRYRGQLWRVRELVQGAGGVAIAQLESLVADDYRAVSADHCTAVEMTDHELETRLAEREAAMAPVRLQKKITLCKRQIHRATMRGVRAKEENDEVGAAGFADKAAGYKRDLLALEGQVR